jgi:hypothetical protein
LVSVRYCFNAKPDILLVSKPTAVFIEIKVESGREEDNELNKGCKSKRLKASEKTYEDFGIEIIKFV